MCVKWSQNLSGDDFQNWICPLSVFPFLSPRRSDARAPKADHRRADQVVIRGLKTPNSYLKRLCI